MLTAAASFIRAPAGIAAGLLCQNLGVGLDQRAEAERNGLTHVINFDISRSFEVTRGTFALGIAFLIWNKVSVKRHQQTGGSTSGLGGKPLEFTMVASATTSRARRGRTVAPAVVAASAAALTST